MRPAKLPGLRGLLVLVPSPGVLFHVLDPPLFHVHPVMLALSRLILYLKSPKSPFELELTINHDRETSYDIGDGYGHLAVLVDDLDAEHSRMKGEGLQPGDLREIELGAKARFFFIEDPDRYKIEVIGRSGRFQDL